MSLCSFPVFSNSLFSGQGNTGYRYLRVNQNPWIWDLTQDPYGFESTFYYGQLEPGQVPFYYRRSQICLSLCAITKWIWEDLWSALIIREMQVCFYFMFYCYISPFPQMPDLVTLTHFAVFYFEAYMKQDTCTIYNTKLNFVYFHNLYINKIYFTKYVKMPKIVIYFVIWHTKHYKQVGGEPIHFLNYKLYLSFSQYLVWPPFASRSATHLLRIELIRLLIVACGMLVNSSSMAVRNCWILAGTGTRCRIRRSRASQTCSMGDMSGEYAGHARTGMFSASRNCVQILATWGRPLSCCNMRWWSWMNGTTMGLRISSWYLCAFTMPSIKCTCVRRP